MADHVRVLVAAIAAITVLSGAVQILFTGWDLELLDADSAPASRHFFAIVGMFMVLFGGMVLHALRAPRSLPVVLLWGGLQKFGASVAVALGVVTGVFSPLALGVAAFDLVSGAIYLWHREQVR